jgi:hypothetical protein
LHRRDLAAGRELAALEPGQHDKLGFGPVASDTHQGDALGLHPQPGFLADLALEAFKGRLTALEPASWQPPRRLAVSMGKDQHLALGVLDHADHAHQKVRVDAQRRPPEQPGRQPETAQQGVERPEHIVAGPRPMVRPTNAEPA